MYQFISLWSLFNVDILYTCHHCTVLQLVVQQYTVYLSSLYCLTTGGPTVYCITGIIVLSYNRRSNSILYTWHHCTVLQLVVQQYTVYLASLYCLTTGGPTVYCIRGITVLSYNWWSNSILYTWRHCTVLQLVQCFAVPD